LGLKIVHLSHENTTPAHSPFCYAANHGTKIFSVDYESQADVKIFFVEHES